MNFMCSVSECDFDGAKTLKLSVKTAVFGRFLQFFGKKNKEKAQKFGRGGLFHFFKFRDLPEIGQICKN